MAKSIVQEDKENCYLCGMNRNLEPLDKHHVYGASNRKHSEKYGLTVYLHHRKCHIFGENSVHVNSEVREQLQAEVQRKAMKHYNWSVEDFRGVFGRSFI